MIWIGTVNRLLPGHVPTGDLQYQTESNCDSLSGSLSKKQNRQTLICHKVKMSFFKASSTLCRLCISHNGQSAWVPHNAHCTIGSGRRYQICSMFLQVVQVKKPIALLESHVILVFGFFTSAMSKKVWHKYTLGHCLLYQGLLLLLRQDQAQGDFPSNQ